MIGMQAGSPKFQEPEFTVQQRGKIEFGRGIEPARGLGVVRGHQPVNADDAHCFAVAVVKVAQQQMVGMSIERIGLDPSGVINPVAVATKFGHENIVPQPLCGLDLVRRPGKRDLKLGGVLEHLDRRTGSPTP